MNLLMELAFGLRCERGLTNLTRKWFVFGVRQLMSFQRLLKIKSGRTQRTFKMVLTLAMHSLFMPTKFTGAFEIRWAIRAFERLVIIVDDRVKLQILLRTEPILALITLERSFSVVFPFMH